MENNLEYFGHLVALSTAICWTLTAVSFEYAGKLIGSLSLNLHRLIFGFVFLTIYTFISRGIPFPTDADSTTWLWLFFSGIIGVVLGDLLLFRAFIEIGSRISMLIYSLVPPLTGIFSFLILGESMRYSQILGMMVTLYGISLVILKKESKQKVKLSHPIRGILLALGGAVGQSLGLILSKFALKDYDVFAATQIRLIAGIIGFAIIITFSKRWSRFFASYKNKKGMILTLNGSFWGPFLGISFSLLALKYVEAGVASTIMSVVPVFIIPFSIFLFKEKIQFKEIIGALIAFLGVTILFLV